MSRGVYLRADGRLPCYCGAGETITLGHIPVNGKPFHFIKDYYKNDLYALIRESMSYNMVPFPGICDQCAYLEVDNRFEEELIDEEIDWFQWEPSSLCTLDCRWCADSKDFDTKKSRNKILSSEIFDNIVTDIAQHGLRLNMGNVCGVGEPTLNPHVWKMIHLVRTKLGGNILLSTNGNRPYSDDIVSSGLDKIKIAVDGINQDIYERYRKGGSLQKAISFTKAIAEQKLRMRLEKPTIIWQYIMFNYNDSDEDLITYQKMADENGVDQLRIVYTDCGNYSIRTPEDFPKIFSNIIFDPIGNECQLNVSELMDSWSNITAVRAQGGLQEAALETIRLVNKLYRRLTLGAETYHDLLNFTRVIQHISGANPLNLSKKMFEVCVQNVYQGFRMLEELYRDMDREEQANLYRSYAGSIRIES